MRAHPGGERRRGKKADLFSPGDAVVESVSDLGRQCVQPEPLMGRERGTVDKRLYLRVGDRVFHRVHEAWGEGRVVELMTSVVPGGTCLARILFEDGRQRTFGNDLDSESCCYFFGIRRVWQASLETIGEPTRAPRRTTRRLIGRIS